MADPTTLTVVLRFLVPAVYGTAAAGYVAEFLGNRNRHFSWTLPILISGIALHALLFAALVFDHRQMPCDTVFRGLLFCALIVSLLYVGLERFLGEIRYGSFMVPLNFIATAAAAVYLDRGVPLPERLHSPYFVTHATLLFSAYACFFMSFVISCMYQLQHRQIKNRRLGGLFKRLPSLAVMDKSVMRVDVLGLVLLVAGIATGFLWMERALVDPNRLSLKIGFAILTAVVYLAEYLLRIGRGWNGQRACWLSIAGFAFVFLTMLAGRHGY